MPTPAFIKALEILERHKGELGANLDRVVADITVAVDRFVDHPQGDLQDDDAELVRRLPQAVFGGLRKVTIPLELVRIEFNALDPPPLAAEAHHLLHQMMLTLLEGSGRILKDGPEGLIVLLGNSGQIGNYHESLLFLSP
jgi:hypothetical protein